MDVSIILTYRCNSKCSMCYVWQHPTLPQEEVPLATLAKIPSGVDYLNLTGGEPTLREDLLDIVDLLHPKAMQLEISSNGSYPERLEPIIRRYPDVKIRFSLEGFELTNNRIRGERGGFDRKVKGLLRLKELGGKDLGFAVTIQDDNGPELAKLFQFAEKHGVELATSTLHNGFQFHKNDNRPYNGLRVAQHIESLINQQLRSRSVKNWFRAYLNLGLIAKVLGHDRILKCTAAADFVFIDPWSDVFACNVRPDLRLGNLNTSSWEGILDGPKARSIRELVDKCTQNCWMVGSAKTAMRVKWFPKLPKAAPILWVARNKLRVTFGRSADLGQILDPLRARQGPVGPARPSFLDAATPRHVQTGDDPYYAQLGEFLNE
ncbi:MAG: radical SAM protein [Chloroflexi bacterium]|nr:radical SAM protein [Chloroflexota bacterium]